MDLAKQIKLDPQKTDDGVWFPFMQDAAFKVRAAGTDAHRLAQAEITERYRPQLRVGGAVAVEARMSIMRELAADYHIADWEKIEDEGVALPCDHENRRRICTKYAAVVMFVTGCGTELSPYRLTDEPDDVTKN